MSKVRIAADTNVLMHLADGIENVVESIQLIQKRRPDAEIIITPTVIQELAFKADFGDSEEEKRLGYLALSQSIKKHKIKAYNLIPAGHGIVEIIGKKIRAAKLLPEEEVHDSFIIAEAALLGCSMLITSDEEILSIPHEKLMLLLNRSDVITPIIVKSPKEILRRFM